MRITDLATVLQMRADTDKKYHIDPLAPAFSVTPLKTQAKPARPAERLPDAKAGSKAPSEAHAQPRTAQATTRSAPRSRADQARSKEQDQAASREGDTDADDDPDGMASITTAVIPIRREDADPDERGSPEEQGKGQEETAAAWRMENPELELIGGQLEQMSASSGIFEILLPDGGVLGVVVDRNARGMHVLLNADDDQRRKNLLGNQMELERRLERRMGMDVRITVL